MEGGAVTKHGGGLAEPGDRLPHPGTVGQVHERAHVGAGIGRIADPDVVEGRDECLLERRLLVRGDEDPADRRALLTGLGGHLPDDLPDEQVELGRVRRGCGGEDGGVEGVGLAVQRNQVSEQRRVGAQGAQRLGGAGHGEHVLLAEVFEQVTGLGTEELDGPVREDVAVDDLLEEGVGEVCRLGGGLDQGGHAGEECGRQLLEHPPAGEVEGVEVHRHAPAGGLDVGTHDAAVASEDLGVAVGEDRAVGQFAPALACEGEQDAGAALDVGPGIGAGGAGGGREFVELLGAGEQVLPEVAKQ